jgi:hypothetical protein
MQKQGQTTTLPGVFSTLSAGFELTTRYLWLMVIPAALDLFLWIGPRLSFRTLIENLIATSLAQLPADVLALDAGALTEAAGRVNHFTYLSVSLLGVPALMAGPMPEQTPITPLVIEGGGLGAWFGWLAAFTLVGLLLTAVFYNLIAYAMRRSPAAATAATAATTGPATAAMPPLGPARFLRRTLQTWLRLVALLAVAIVLMLVIIIPVALLAGFVALLSQAMAVFVLFGAVVLLMWLLMFLSYTPQGMLLNPRRFPFVIADSVRLFQRNLPAALGLLAVVLLARQLLHYVLLTADSGTWVTTINILAHAYIATALTVALFIFYRDRFVAYLRQIEQSPQITPVSQVEER